MFYVLHCICVRTDFVDLTVKENFLKNFFTYMKSFEICFCYWESLVVLMWPCAGWQHVLSKYQLTPTHVPWFYTVLISCLLQFLWALGFPSCCHLSFLVHFLWGFRVLVSWFLRFLSPGFSNSYHLIFPAQIFRYLRFLFRSLFLGSPSSRLLVSVVHISRCLQFFSLVFCIFWIFRISPVTLSLPPTPLFLSPV